MSDQVEDRGIGTPVTRRVAIMLGLALAGGMLATVPARSASAAPRRQATPVASAPGD